MSTDDNRALVQRFCTEVFVEGSSEAIESLVTDDFVDGSPGSFSAGRVGLRQHVDFLRSTFGEYRFTVQDEIANEDKVVLFWTLHGTNHGKFLGLAPTGKPIDARIVSLFTLRDGRVAVYRGHPDVWGVVTQLGATVNVAMPESG